MRQETDRIIIVLKMRVSGYTGWLPGECISDTGYVSDYREIHRTWVYARWKSLDADQWTYGKGNRTKSKKSVGNVKEWCEVYAYATGCAINIGEIKAERIVFAGSILALIIWYEKISDKIQRIWIQNDINVYWKVPRLSHSPPNLSSLNVSQGKGFYPVLGQKYHPARKWK